MVSITGVGLVIKTRVLHFNLMTLVTVNFFSETRMSTQRLEKCVPPKHSGLTRIMKAGGYSLQGMYSAWQSEAAFRQECLLALLLVPAFLFMDLSSLDRFMLILATAFVLVTELLNSALETVVDRIGVEYHELSGKAKDIGSAAVFIALLVWAYTWIEVLFLV